MKKGMLSMSSLVVLIILITNLTVFAQEVVIPAVVQATFENKYPNAIDVNWDQDGEEFLAGFEEGDYYLEVTISEDGTWVQTFAGIFLEDLPTAAQQLIKQKYVVEEYNGISKVTTPQQIRFYVNFETTKQAVSLSFDEHGKLVETEVEDFE